MQVLGHNHSKQLHSRAAADTSSSSLANIYAAIYYGDSEVNVGDPFAITCRIAIMEPVNWIKDGVVLTGHRHGGHTTRNDFVFTETQAKGYLSALINLANRPMVARCGCGVVGFN